MSSDVTIQGLSCSKDTEKYRSLQYPPMPPDNDTFTDRGGFMTGRLPKMKEKWTPLFQDSSKCQTCRRMVIIFVAASVEGGQEQYMPIRK